jgi:hypothetical protein
MANETLVADVAFIEDALVMTLKDGRSIETPLAWYPRLYRATPEQRAHFEFIGNGYGIHWPDVDEDVSAEGLLKGLRSAEYGKSGG